MTDKLSPQFRALSWRLLLSYLGAMGVVVGVSTAAMYQIFVSNLYQRVDEQLQVLANAAAHALPEVLEEQSEEVTPERIFLDDDGDLDLPWQDIQQEHQSIEWFDAQGQLISRTGNYVSTRPLSDHVQVWQNHDVRVLSVPVYASANALNTQASNSPPPIEGYVRVSDWLEDEEEELERLLIGMGWGAAVALILMGMTGWWLTQRSLQPIERSFQQLQQFTADASHELRSPLTAVRTAVEVMQSHPERIHPADVSKLGAIASATQQMATLVDDLLLLARADSTAPGADKTILIPISEILEDLVDALQEQAAASGVTLSMAGTGDIYVKGDAGQLKRLFANLLENALYYTPAGGQVNVSLSTPNAVSNIVHIYVRDTGIGIAPEHLPLVFDRFWRADQARSRRAGGSGLGLAIAQAIAQAHRGSIQATSEVNVGTCFQVTLPLA